jgi:transposase
LEEDQKSIEILRTILGVDKSIAVNIVPERAVKLEETFDSPKRLAKWAGVCLGNNESGGKKLSGRTTKHIGEAAWEVTRTKGTYLRAKFDRMVGRMGKKKARLVIGHKILCAVYHILTSRLT